MSDFLDKWLSSGRSPDPRKLSRLTVKADKWDAEDFESVLAEMPDFDGARNRLCDKVDTGNGATADAFYGFFKGNPMPLDEGEIRPDYLVNARVRDEMKELREYEELRALGTVGDDVNAALAFVTMRPDLEVLFDKLKKEQELAKKLQKQMEDYYDMQEASDEAGDGEAQAIEDGDPDKAKDFQKQKDKINKSMQSLREIMEKAAQNIQQQLDDKSGAIKSALSKSMRKAADDAKDLQGMTETWGNDPGSLTRLPADERMKLAKRIKDKPKLKQLAKLVGPMKRYMVAARRRKVDHAREEIFNIEQGDDLDRVLPDELLKLVDDDTEMEFFKNYLEGSLLLYEMRGTEKVGLGGIICIMDQSGSMSGQREIWAKAVGLSLLHLARTQKRSFKGIHFGSPGQLCEFDFSKPEDYTPQKVIDYAEFFYGGGTDFMTPLARSLDHLQREHAEGGVIKGDIVFITDGECGVPQEFIDEFKAEQERLGFQVFGVMVGGGFNDEPLATICDRKVVTVKDLTSGNEMESIFQGIHEP